MGLDIRLSTVNASTFSSPIKPEGPPLPTYHSLRLNNDQRISPAWPDLRQYFPKHLIAYYQTRTTLISLRYNELLAQSKILSSQIGDDIKLAFEAILEFLDEKQHHQTLIWKRLKRNGINVYEYLRRTTYPECLYFSIK